MRFRSPILVATAFSLAFSAFAEDEVLQPTWETRRHARTYVFAIPAPRGQIVDRNGEPLALTRVAYNLGISFPTPLEFTDEQVIQYARDQIARAEALTGRKITVTNASILRHYRNRGLLPLDIAQDLTPAERKQIEEKGGQGLALRPVYLRVYPHGTLAAHILRYAGRAGKQLETPLQNNDLLWPEAEGREGLELAFNEQLTGKLGQMTFNYDSRGHKVSEKVSIPPEQGYNVVTTIDLKLQQMCEKALREGTKRGAIVIMDPRNGDILAMASWPTFDPNLFIPAISNEKFKELSEDPNFPLIPRAFRSAYPPGSVFKMIFGVAALETGKISTTTKLPGPPAMQIGNIVMRNWKKTDAGMLDYAEALEQSCDTWFYQVGIKVGASPVVEWSRRFGFGDKTGIPLKAEAAGRIPDDDYMRKTHGRRLLDGDLANMSIGQGDVLVTPLQMAQAMCVLANGGTLFQTRLVKQVQSLDDKVVTGYQVRIKDELEIKPEILEATKKGMILATSGGRGTGRRASLSSVKVAGKTGTAQWGPKAKERYAAWFAGFVPADNPEYAFAVIYESDPLETHAHGGTVAAPIIGKILRELYPEKKGKGSKSKPTPTPEPESELDEST